MWILRCHSSKWDIALIGWRDKTRFHRSRCPGFIGMDGR
ncbi:hypothetical protein pah_c207o030 [Parachlamydia acanthamoebae str. Hall's coccus]|nr:hypothetical protein pah_c207o030 [Parachlamydia acanthamoebae str. Hall's coccus]